MDFIQKEPRAVTSVVSEFRIRKVERKSGKSQAVADHLTIGEGWASLSLARKLAGVRCVVLLLFMVQMTGCSEADTGSGGSGETGTDTSADTGSGGNPRDELSQIVSQMGSRAVVGIESSLSFEAVYGGKRTSMSNGTAIQKFGESLFDPITTITLAVTDWDFDASDREGTIEVTELRNLMTPQETGVEEKEWRYVTTLHLEYDGQRFRLYRVRIAIHEKETVGSRVISDNTKGPVDVPERLEVNTLAPVKVMVGDLF